MTLNPKKAELIKKLYHKATEVQHKTLLEEDLGKQWLMKHSPSSDVTAVIEDMTVLMLHILEAIGQLEPVNGITISKQFDISRGSISKVTKKLEDKGLIIIESLPSNKKELYFHTTPLGQVVCALHHALHQEIDAGVHQFLQQYDEDALQATLTILTDAMQTSWLSLEVKDEKCIQQVTPLYDESRSATDMTELTTMLQQLDGKKLKKAKNILRIIFFEE
ncbi:MarR family transcriptional regulator [Bacillus toyonensis]|uniref:MarR family transcriptional regulator n=1 Tax=Bacillus toyonensis TaxID=155322 RepID=UPI002175DB59|nr:MarR family transcriptional regulator [Bacillus toyonensis]